MQCEEWKVRIEKLISGTLPDEDRLQLAEHLGDCPQCSSYFVALKEDDVLLSGFVDSLEQGVKDLPENVIAKLDDSQNDMSFIHTIWSGIMKNNIYRYAALVIAILGLIFILSLFSRPNVTFTAWDQVTAKVEQAHTVTWNSFIEDPQEGRVEVMNYLSMNHGFRADIKMHGSVVATSYYSMDEKAFITLIPSKKQYFVIPVDMEELYEEEELQDLRSSVGKFFELEHTEIGSKWINGVMAAGIEINDPRLLSGDYDTGIGRLWVDVETQFPVRMEFEMSAAGGKIKRKMTVEKFDWDASLDATDLLPVIPDDYELSVQFDRVKKDEASAIEGLRSYAMVANGRYPSTLSIQTAIYEAKKARGVEDLEIEDDIRVLRIQSTSMFFRELTNADKDVKYFGGTVLAGEKNKILMRWKVDTAKYRVIFGDLSVVEISEEELHKLEAELR